VGYNLRREKRERERERERGSMGRERKRVKKMEDDVDLCEFWDYDVTVFRGAERFSLCFKF
jgi:hypothetical protein